MRWIACVKGAGLVLAGAMSVAPAQSAPPGGYYTPYGAPPACASPAVPPRAIVTPPGTAMPGAPGTAAPGAAAPGAMAPGAAAAAAAAAADPGTGAGGERGSDALASAAPNMYGDAFAGAPVRILNIGRSSVAQRIGGFINSTAGGPALYQISSLNGVTAFFPPTPPPNTANGTPLTQPFLASGPLTGGPNGQSVFPLRENSQETNSALTFARETFGPGATVVYVSDPNFSYALQVSPLNANISVFYDIFAPQRSVIYLPGAGGGVVGRTKVSDDNNPLPRDRVIFNYDYFNSVTLGSGGVGVHRFSPGVEYAFLDQNASVEVRVPFASTLDSTFNSDGTGSRATEFGDVHLNFKGLLYSSEQLYLSGGLGVAIPTASDINLKVANGASLLRMSNDSWVLTPYVAALLIPDDRLFAQVWYAVGFDAAGSGIDASPSFAGGGLRGVGRLYNAPLSQLDTQLGYWIIQPNGRDTLQGLAGFVELHYNAALGSGKSVHAGGFQVAQQSGFNELNVSAGVTAIALDNLNVSVGAVVPLLQGSNRTFDYQIGIRASYFFGATADSRRAALAASNF